MMHLMSQADLRRSAQAALFGKTLSACCTGLISLVPAIGKVGGGRVGGGGGGGYTSKTHGL